MPSNPGSEIAEFHFTLLCRLVCILTQSKSNMGVTLLFLLLMKQTNGDASNGVLGYWKLQCGDKVFHWDPKEGAPGCECGQTTDLYSTAVKSSGEVIEAYHAFKKDKFSRWCCVQSNSKCEGSSLGNLRSYGEKRLGNLEFLTIFGFLCPGRIQSQRLSLHRRS